MSYNADSIELRSFREAAQSTPGMYLGDDGQGGVFNAFMEILNNSCDEAIMGRGRRIEVYLEDNDNKVTVVDYGAGIPRGPKGDIPEILIELFTAAHSSGKFNSNNYKKVRGIHGVGQSATCVTSEYFIVNVKRDGYRWELEFDNGVPRTETAVRKEATKETGTEISFTPNKKVFHISATTPAFDAKRIEDELHLTSFFIPEVEFIFHHNGKKKTFYSKNGLKDFAAEKIKDPLHKGYIYGYKEFEDEVEIEVFAQWTLGKEKSYVFSNGALNSEGGSPIAGARSAFTRTVNSLSKKSFDGDAIRKGLVYIINIRHPHPIYSNQVKTKIQNPELRGYTQTVFTEALKDFARDNRKDFEKVVEILEKDQKADAAAERARKQVLEATRDIERNQKKKVFNSDKLKDAETLGEDSTLLLVEGNSAAASLAIARDPKKYGILALRGKSLNPLSNTEEKALQNEEIKLILSALGVTPGKYNPKKLRYGKIGIASDADR